MKTMKTMTTLAAALLIGGCATAPKHPNAATPDLARYHAVVVESVRIAPEAGLLSNENRQELERQMLVALVDSIPVERRAATTAADTLRVQVTVTALEAVSPIKNGVSTMLLGVPLDRGSIAFEARYYAPDGSEPFAQVSEQRKAGAFAFAGSMSHYGHARVALREWGADLAKSLERT